LPEDALANRDTAGPLRQRVQMAQALAARARQRLASLNLPAPDEAAGSGAGRPAESADAKSLYIAARREVSQLTLHATQVAGGRTFAAGLGATLLIGLGLIAVPLGRWHVAQEWLAAHAHLLLALAGLLWWLVAPLGWLGWLAVLAALWLSVRSG
jgi:hypothetical protein